MRWPRPPELEAPTREIPISVLETLVRDLSTLVAAQTQALQSTEPKMVSVLGFGGLVVQLGRIATALERIARDTSPAAAGFSQAHAEAERDPRALLDLLS
jgi:hypothetical protein